MKSVGFDLNPMQTKWDSFVKAYVDFVRQHGRYPQTGDIVEGKDLGYWSTRIRKIKQDLPLMLQDSYGMFMKPSVRPISSA